MELTWPVRLTSERPSVEEDAQSAERAFTYLVGGPDGANFIVWGSSRTLRGSHTHSLYIAVASPCCPDEKGQVIIDSADANPTHTFTACSACGKELDLDRDVSITHNLDFEGGRSSTSWYKKNSIARQETLEQWIEDRLVLLGLDVNPLDLAIQVSSLRESLSSLAWLSYPYLTRESTWLPFADSTAP